MLRLRTWGVGMPSFIDVARGISDWIRVAGCCYIAYDKTRPLVSIANVQSYTVSVKSPRVSLRLMVPEDATAADIESLRVDAIGGLTAALAPFCVTTEAA